MRVVRIFRIHCNCEIKSMRGQLYGMVGNGTTDPDLSYWFSGKGTGIPVDQSLAETGKILIAFLK